MMLLDVVPEGYVRTIDALSQRGLIWFLIAALGVTILLVVFLGRRIMKDSETIRKEFKDLNSKYVEMLQINAGIQEKTAVTVQMMGTQVAAALDNSNRAIANNTSALAETSNSITQLSKHSNDQVRAFYDLEQALRRSLRSAGPLNENDNPPSR